MAISNNDQNRLTEFISSIFDDTSVSKSLDAESDSGSGIEFNINSRRY